MTKEEAQLLIKRATPFIGRRRVLSFKHPQTEVDIIEKNSQFVGTDENEEDGDYNPLAVWQENGEIWTEDLSGTIYFFENNPEKANP
jgi:hypothetical protein